MIPDLIVADYQLGGGENGIALIDQVRNRFGQPIPALLLTAYTGNDHRAPAAKRGIAILEKPMRPARLRLALEASLKTAATPPA